MERLFSPCQGRLDEFRSRCTERLRELNLDVSTEMLLGAERAFTYADLYTMLGNGSTAAWLTPHAAVIYFTSAGMLSSWLPLEESCLFTFHANLACHISCHQDPVATRCNGPHADLPIHADLSVSIISRGTKCRIIRIF
jgi:hypothetical protein